MVAPTEMFIVLIYTYIYKFNYFFSVGNITLSKVNLRWILLSEMLSKLTTPLITVQLGKVVEWLRKDVMG